jgi:hypothetical protein
MLAYPTAADTRSQQSRCDHVKLEAFGGLSFHELTFFNIAIDDGVQ